jgi:hypothetical protein
LSAPRRAERFVSAATPPTRYTVEDAYA